MVTGFGRGATGRGLGASGAAGFAFRERPRYSVPMLLPGVFSIA